MRHMVRWLATATVGLAATLSLACAAPSHTDEARADVDPVRALIGQATADAQAMEQHAAMMSAYAVARPGLRGWASEADGLRGDARSMRLIAAAASSILRDPGVDPVSSSEPRRALADGLNLERLGEALIAQADAMQAHLAAMRAQAAGDADVLAAIDASPLDIAGMLRDGEAAIAHGERLVGLARRVAATTGQRIE